MDKNKSTPEILDDCFACENDFDVIKPKCDVTLSLNDTDENKYSKYIGS